MPENMTKKRKAAARKARRRRRQRRQLGLMSLFLLVCVGAFASLSLLNRRAPDRAEAQQWYVADGEMQILAAPAAGTLDSRTGAASTLPFLAATAEPTAQPAAHSRATGGAADESIRATIRAGANAIVWTPPSSAELFRDVMKNYREGKPHP